MKIKRYVLLGFLLWSGRSIAQLSDYSLNAVPDKVRRNASSVMRYENIEFEVSDMDHARLNIHQIVTVISESGKQALEFVKETDKFSSLDNVEIRLYDSTGKVIGKYKQKDLNAFAIGEDLIDDSKTNFLNIHVSSFPVTVEYKYTIRYKGLLTYPRYAILKPGQGVESSIYTARVPKDMDLRYLEKNIHLTPSFSIDGDYKVYNWSVKDLAPVEYEEGAVGYRNRYPSILLAPNLFRLDGYEGNMSSWTNFGKWYSDLQKGMDVLPEDRIAFFKNMVKDQTGDREKVKMIYSYLQKNFRYVSIQLGIGGYRPLPAAFTDNKKYGDCKGLSNYVQAVLHAIGIKSYQALINSEYNEAPVDSGFPCNQFDHVIVCVPFQKDSIWLECTSRTNDFGSLGNFTENRNALLITEDGGVLVPTPRSRSEDNIFNACTHIELREDGSGKATAIILVHGEYKQDAIHLFEEKPDEQRSYVINQWGYKEPDKISFQKQEKGGDLKMLIDLEIEKIPDLVTGTKMFLPVRIYNLWGRTLPKAEDRKQDFYFSCPFEKTDTTIFKLPAGYTIDALPETKVRKCTYATYSTKCWWDEKNGQVYTTEKIVLISHHIAASEYPALKRFFDEVTKDNAQRVVIKK